MSLKIVFPKTVKKTGVLIDIARYILFFAKESLRCLEPL
jgi:hypothetical protein